MNKTEKKYCGNCKFFDPCKTYNGLLGECNNPKSRYPKEISGLINDIQTCNKHQFL